MSVKRYLAGPFALLMMVGGEARAGDYGCITQPGNAAAGADKCVAQDDCTFEDGVSCQTFNCASGASVPCCAAEGADYMWCNVPGIGPIDVNLPPEPDPVLVPDDLGDPNGYGIESTDWWWWGYLKEAREASAACMLPEGADVPLPDATCTATDVCWGPTSMQCQEVACEGSEDQVCCYTGGDTVDCAPVSSPEGMLPYLLPGAPESPLGEPTPEPDDEGGSLWDDLTQWWGDLWHREACLSTRADLPPWWGDVCGEPIPPVSPPLPPLTEDDGEEPSSPPSGCWTTPSGERLCPGEDGREATLAQVRDFFEDLGMFSTEDGADDPTPTLDDPSEFVEHNPLGTEYRSAPDIEVPPLVWQEPARPPTPEPTPTPEGTPTAAQVDATPEPLVCPPGTVPAFGGLLCLGWWVPGSDWRVDWSVEPDLKEACVTEVIDQPVSVQDEDGSSAAYLGGCEIEVCPGEEPVTTCCTGASLSGEVTCQVIDSTSELYPYQPHTSIWEALEWLLTPSGSGEIPAGYEGPWRYYLYSSATEGR